MTQQRTGLVRPAELRALLDGPDDAVAAEVAADPQGYYSGHLPGAVLLDWFDDVHDPDRRGVVGKARFERLLSERGVSRDTHVVLYDDNLNKHAAYAHWLFRYYRHERVSVLDGGRSAWVAGGEPLVLTEPERPPTTYTSPGPDPALRVTRDDLLATFVHAPEGTVLVDGRAPHVYRGRPGSNADDLPLLGLRLAGHIPGAVNLQAERLLDPDGRFLPTEQLEQVFADLGVRPQSEVAVYCAGGEQSSLLWFALAELLGHRAVRHYDGGWAEYGGLVDVPVER